MKRWRCWWEFFENVGKHKAIKIQFLDFFKQYVAGPEITVGAPF